MSLLDRGRRFRRSITRIFVKGKKDRATGHPINKSDPIEDSLVETYSLANSDDKFKEVSESINSSVEDGGKSTCIPRYVQLRPVPLAHCPTCTCVAPSPEQAYTNDDFFSDNKRTDDEGEFEPLAPPLEDGISHSSTSTKSSKEDIGDAAHFDGQVNKATIGGADADTEFDQENNTHLYKNTPFPSTDELDETNSDYEPLLNNLSGKHSSDESCPVKRQSSEEDDKVDYLLFPRDDNDQNHDGEETEADNEEATGTSKVDVEHTQCTTIKNTVSLQECDFEEARELYEDVPAQMQIQPLGNEQKVKRVSYTLQQLHTGSAAVIKEENAYSVTTHDSSNSCIDAGSDEDLLHQRQRLAEPKKDKSWESLTLGSSSDSSDRPPFQGVMRADHVVINNFTCTCNVQAMHQPPVLNLGCGPSRTSPQSLTGSVQNVCSDVNSTDVKERVREVDYSVPPQGEPQLLHAPHQVIQSVPVVVHHGYSPAMAQAAPLEVTRNVPRVDGAHVVHGVPGVLKDAPTIVSQSGSAQWIPFGVLHNMQMAPDYAPTSPSLGIPSHATQAPSHRAQYLSSEPQSVSRGAPRDTTGRATLDAPLSTQSNVPAGVPTDCVPLSSTDGVPGSFADIVPCNIPGIVSHNCTGGLSGGAQFNFPGGGSSGFPNYVPRSFAGSVPFGVPCGVPGSFPSAIPGSIQRRSTGAVSSAGQCASTRGVPGWFACDVTGGAPNGAALGAPSGAPGIVTGCVSRGFPGGLIQVASHTGTEAFRHGVPSVVQHRYPNVMPLGIHPPPLHQLPMYLPSIHAPLPQPGAVSSLGLHRNHQGATNSRDYQEGSRRTP